ncbi:MAG: glycosyltransferase [Vicinamibacterales bacterium]
MQNVCLVIPCYNEERRLDVPALSAFLRTHPQMAFCLVDDGSSDGTLGLLESLRAAHPDQVIVHPLSPNGGKAAAVRAGVRHAAASGTWPVIGYWDANLSTPLAEVEHLLEPLTNDPACTLVMGSRVKRFGARIERRLVRHVLGRIFAACATGVLGFSVYRLAVRRELFRRELVDLCFGDPFLTRWLFDLEILARLRNTRDGAGLAGAREVPLRAWLEVGGSKLRLREMINVPLELLEIRRHYRIASR